MQLIISPFERNLTPMFPVIPTMFLLYKRRQMFLPDLGVVLILDHGSGKVKSGYQTNSIHLFMYDLQFV